jgi:type IV secretion system protein TrbL
VTLIDFKLTTLAGFVLVPFALWNKTAFLAEKVLGNVVSSGVKVLVLAVIVGIGSTIFGQFQTPAGADPSLNHALAIMLASLTMLGLGIFGPSITTGLVSGAPQLDAGAAAGTALGVAGFAVAGGAAVATGGAAVAAGARLAARGAVGTARAAMRCTQLPCSMSSSSR